MALVASLQPRDGDFFHRAAHRFAERNINLIFQIAARLFFVSLRRVRAAKYLAEKILEARSARSAEVEAAKIELHILRRSARARSASTGIPALKIRPGKAELVVHLAFFRVRKVFVRFLYLLEFFFCGFVPGIQVGMILSRGFAVGLPDFL